MGNNITTLRTLETAALQNDGVIDAGEAKALAKAATTKEDKAVVRDMLAHDRFDAGRKDRKTIATLLGVSSLPRKDALVGDQIPGVKGAFIQRVLGDAAGYDSKHRAIAVARASGLDHAMVVKGADNKWHAVESNTLASSTTGSSGEVREALHVGKLDQTTFDSLKAKATSATGTGRVAAWKAFASYALGVPPGEISVINKGEAPVAGHVNINLDPGFDPEGRVPGFDPNKPELVELGPKAFDRPANAVATLAHEEVHTQHYRQTAALYDTYKDSKSKDSFRLWAAKHMKGSDFKEVMKADIVAGFEDGTHAATELFAYVEAAKVAFLSGDLVQAKTDLSKVATLPALPLTQTQSMAQDELRRLRASLPEDVRDLFDDVVKKAKSGVLVGL